MVIRLRVVQFGLQSYLWKTNRTPADFVVTRTIRDRIGLHSVLLSLLVKTITKSRTWLVIIRPSRLELDRARHVCALLPRISPNYQLFFLKTYNWWLVYLSNFVIVLINCLQDLVFSSSIHALNLTNRTPNLRSFDFFILFCDYRLTWTTRSLVTISYDRIILKQCVQLPKESSFKIWL